MDTVKTIVKGKICQKSFLFPEFNIKKKKIKSDLCRNEMFCHNSAHIPPCEGGLIQLNQVLWHTTCIPNRMSSSI
ncbi:uncharacterized protein [Nicotiana tomentosiformis]|uniref:uncharacterized protein isoform X4 n=1 Tax=Nicotiana tomentosiformis TaxID=4098 RepID=UPI00388C3E2D